MRVLALDPGAARMGWAILERGQDTVCLASGIWECLRMDQSYQDYRLQIIQEWIDNTDNLLGFYRPQEIVSEILPVRGFNNMSQAILAQTAITTVHVTALQEHLPVHQVSAVTVKTRIGKSPKATKVAVRNGVLELLPELAYKKSQWVKVFDESDAIAVGLTHLGYDLRTT